MHQANKPNRLIHEKSPYLLQHAYNPVDWYPWGEEAFAKAKSEDKPVFLSIGYSTCHWCHVMAHESFEDDEIAQLLNKDFISIKVDKEERPDIDSIYMSVCQAYTGSGGWPMSIFITPDQKPFFAGTYFPKRSAGRMVGLTDLLLTVNDKWHNDRDNLLKHSNEVIALINKETTLAGEVSPTLLKDGFSVFARIFDAKHGGFGNAPKFPTPHNLLFLMDYYLQYGEKSALDMAEKTLIQLYKGGIFDHIGFGFSRYSTDKYFLVPHFEKMLYDNALLLMAYAKVYEITGKEIYKEIAEKTVQYIMRELRDPAGGFYSAQDADSDGVEGKYYVFDYQEIIDQLGEEAGKRFSRCYDITPKGNFEGKSIPNLLHSTDCDPSLQEYLPSLYAYRKTRTALHLDDKILTSWNALMITALAMLYKTIRDESYLEAAVEAVDFIEKTLSQNGNLFVSCRHGQPSQKGFLDDYAFYACALLHLYEATLQHRYLDMAMAYCNKAIHDFFDPDQGGFYLYGAENEQLIMKPKETYDGAIPSGNSAMAYNLVKLGYLLGDPKIDQLALKQLNYLAGHAKEYPTGHSLYLVALSLYLNPPTKAVVVLASLDEMQQLRDKLQSNISLRLLEQATEEYPLLNGKTTLYLCKEHSCLPPTNDLTEIMRKE